MPTRARAWALASLALLLAVAGCSGGGAEPSQSPASPSSTTSEPDPIDIADEYFEALANADAAGYKRAKQLSAPGSPARQFSEHVRLMSDAQDRNIGAAGVWSVSVSVSNNDVTWSSGPGNAGAQVIEEEFSDFVLDEDERLSTWRIDNSLDLDETLAGEGKSVSGSVYDGTVRLQQMSRYHTPEQLQVAWKASGSRAYLDVGSYSVKKKQYDVLPKFGNVQVPRQGSASVWSLMSQAPVGGTLAVDGDTVIKLPVS